MDNYSEDSLNPPTGNDLITITDKLSVSVNPKDNSLDDERSSLITARGTSDGLVIRLDSRMATESLLSALAIFVEARRSFLGGNEISLEWVGQRPDENTTQRVVALLSSQFSITVKASRLKNQVQKSQEEAKSRGLTVISNPEQILETPSDSKARKTVQFPGTNQKDSGNGARSSLFDGVEGFTGLDSFNDKSAEVSTAGARIAVPWDEPDARVVYTTLRSGQKFESEYSVVILGDVNSGAEVTAGGDIIILGTLRGIAHAGAFDESGGGRIIFCLSFLPTQLRIGTVISRGAGEDRPEPGKITETRSAEIARVENGMIVVEPYQSRSIWGRRRD